MVGEWEVVRRIECFRRRNLFEVNVKYECSYLDKEEVDGFLGGK